MRNTNFQNLKELLNIYVPENFGYATSEECGLIRKILQLEGMEIIELRNLRDFVVLFISRKKNNEPDMVEIDRMSAITAVIDAEITKRGGEV